MSLRLHQKLAPLALTISKNSCILLIQVSSLYTCTSLWSAGWFSTKSDLLLVVSQCYTWFTARHSLSQFQKVTNSSITCWSFPFFSWPLTLIWLTSVTVKKLNVICKLNVSHLLEFIGLMKISACEQIYNTFLIFISLIISG